MQPEADCPRKRVVGERKLVGLERRGPTGRLAGAQDRDGDRGRQREDPDDREGDLGELTAEAEWLVGHEQHREDNGDRGEEDLQLPAPGHRRSRPVALDGLRESRRCGAGFPRWCVG
jgi:hypothetical protein